MPKKDNDKELRPYIFQGVEFDLSTSGDEVTADCPFCGEEGKFNVNRNTSLFKCWHGDCEQNGNSVTFLRKFWQKCYNETTDKEYRDFADESGLMGTTPLREMGCAVSTLKNQWLVPCYNNEGNITGLYRYGRMKKKNKWINSLLISPGNGVHLINRQNIKGHDSIMICEGWRDCLSVMEMTDTIDVVSLSGSENFRPQWSSLFRNRNVIIAGDNDDAGVKCVKKTASILAGSKTPPKSIGYIDWKALKPKKGVSDVRDYLMKVA